MADKKEYFVHEGTNPYEDRGNEGWICTNIDLGKRDEPITDEEGKTYDGQLFAVYVPVPQGADLDELTTDAQSLWGDEATISELMKVAARQISTRPNFKAQLSDGDKADWTIEQFHSNAQDLMTGYEIGRRATAGPTQKAKAKKLDAIEQQAQDELGMTMDELIADAIRRKQAGELG